VLKCSLITRFLRQRGFKRHSVQKSAVQKGRWIKKALDKKGRRIKSAGKKGSWLISQRHSQRQSQDSTGKPITRIVSIIQRASFKEHHLKMLG